MFLLLVVLQMLLNWTKFCFMLSFTCFEDVFAITAAVVLSCFLLSVVLRLLLTSSCFGSSSHYFWTSFCFLFCICKGQLLHSATLCHDTPSWSHTPYACCLFACSMNKQKQKVLENVWLCITTCSNAPVARKGMPFRKGRQSLGQNPCSCSMTSQLLSTFFIHQPWCHQQSTNSAD